MSEQHGLDTALYARIDELERQLAALQQRPSGRGPRLSRRRLAAIGLTLVLLLPGVALAGHQFSDVPDGGFHDDIDWMADNGIANGFDDGTYRPSQPVTRQAMAAFMHRLSNQFEVVESYSLLPEASSTFELKTDCPGDKRAIAGGGFTTEESLLMTSSQPIDASSRPPDVSPSGWMVRWTSDNSATVSPGNITVWALCAPRL